MKTTIALVVDNRRIGRWQEDALLEIQDLADVALILNCTNTANKRHPIRHGAYYALNLVSIRNPATREHGIDFGACPVIDFESRYEGNWQWIPDAIVTRLRDSGCRVVIKFGMSLLKMDNLQGLDVLSFHHGDPRYYRGRPAGFYELLDDAKSIGLMVQKLSNVLDGGQVLALGHAKAYKYSYRQTVEGLYRSSPALLRHAMLNLLAGRQANITPNGKNYRLPSNWLVARFCARLLARKLQRLMYGVFWEKRWNIAVVENLDPTRATALALSDARYPQLPAKYSFYADPFFSADGTCIRAEAMVGTTGRGEIVELDPETLQIRRILLTGPHFSYPYSVFDGGHEYILPEVANHEAPYLLRVTAESTQKIPLRGLEQLRLADSSLIKADERYYLFGGVAGSEASMLQLYVSDAIEGPYHAHRMNPVVMNPLCARMGGRLLLRNDKLYRFGQDNSDSYGNGIRIMEIVKLDTEFYEEQEIGELRFSDASGPHTVDDCNGRAVLDFYVDRFSVLAGYRRLAAMTYSKLFGKP